MPLSHMLGMCFQIGPGPVELVVEIQIKVVGEAQDGLAAINCAETLSPDLVLMDLSMPKMNGLDALKEIKRKQPEIRLVVLTVHKTEEHVHETLKAGAEGYILKKMHLAWWKTCCTEPGIPT